MAGNDEDLQKVIEESLKGFRGNNIEEELLK